MSAPLAVLLIGLPPGGVVTNSPRIKLVEGNGGPPSEQQIQHEIDEFRGWRVAAVAVTIHEDEPNRPEYDDPDRQA